MFTHTHTHTHTQDGKTEAEIDNYLAKEANLTRNVPTPSSGLDKQSSNMQRASLVYIVWALSVRHRAGSKRIVLTNISTQRNVLALIVQMASGFDPADWAMVESATGYDKYDAIYKGRVVCTHIPDFEHDSGAGPEGGWSERVTNARFELNESGEVWVLATRVSTHDGGYNYTSKKEVKARIGVWPKCTTPNTEPKTK